MYEVIFKCRSCLAHLSASADDAGYEFNCPTCDAALVVPAGDILFACPHCQISLLASGDAAGDDFGCPKCQQRVRAPLTGKDIPTTERTAAPLREPSDRPREPSTGKHHAPDTDKSPENTSPGERQFMTTWGDYLAAAGLTGTTKADEKTNEDGQPPLSPADGKDDDVR